MRQVEFAAGDQLLGRALQRHRQFHTRGVIPHHEARAHA
jgi:hypothetical protein